MIVVGIDPGLSGACAVLDHNGLRVVFDLPVMADPIAGPAAKIKNKIDGRALVRLLRQHCPAGEPVKSVLEAIRPMAPKKDGGKDHTAQSQGSLMRTLGTLEAVLECLGWAPQYASPQTWKKRFGLIGPGLTPTARKAKSLECARRLYPECSDIARAKDHNRSEAILIAHHYRQANT
jgi:hypothetical protein